MGELHHVLYRLIGAALVSLQTLGSVVFLCPFPCVEWSRCNLPLFSHVHCLPGHHCAYYGLSAIETLRRLSGLVGIVCLRLLIHVVRLKCHRCYSLMILSCGASLCWLVLSMRPGGRGP